MAKLIKAEKCKRLDLKIGFLCNNNCLHCVQGEKRETIGNRLFSELRKELEKNAKVCTEVVFTGGEPTLHKDFLELINYAKTLGFKNIQVQSNGRMFSYRDFCLETVNRGATEFCFAVHGHKKEIHDFLTDTRGSFVDTVEGIKNIKSLGKRVATNTVISKKNYNYLPEIAGLLIRLGVDQFQFAFVHPTGKAGTNFSIIVPRIKKIMPFIKLGLDMGIRAGKRVMTEGIPYCFMQGYEDCIAEEIIPPTKVLDANNRIADYEKYRRNVAKAKGRQCKFCKYFLVCEGPWREYPERFGWKEFVPVQEENRRCKDSI